MKYTISTAVVFACLFSITLAVAQTSPGGGAASPLQVMLLDEATWTGADVDFMKRAAPLRFVWTSESKGSARSIDRGAVFINEPILETVASFKVQKLYTVLMSVYNKGDTAVIDMKAYDTMVKRVSAALSKLSGVRPRPVNSTRAKSVNLKSSTMAWQSKGISFVLEYASSRTKNPQTRRISESPEYVNLMIVRGGHREVAQVAGDQRVRVNLISLRKNIKKDANGDIHLDNVPMVDQGQKGYCANSTTERVLKYYGAEVNQHKLAQCARTAAGGGTSSDALLKAIKSMAGMLYLRVNVMLESDVRAFLSLMKDYNRAAKKLGKGEIPIPRGGTINGPAIMDAMDRDVFLAARTANPSAVKKFQKDISTKIDRGIPLIWSVSLGFVPEKPAIPQARGGHMRLIIGYNKKTSEVIYTDTWGRGHEFKKMDAGSAYAISKGLFSLEPML